MEAGCREYHRYMRGWGLASIAVLAVFLLTFSLPVRAQINGTPPSVTSPGFGGRAFNGAPPSVTSPGFGGRPFNGTPPSVTSIGPRGMVPNSQRGVGAVPPGQRGDHRGGRGHWRHDHGQYPYYGYGYVYGAPYDYGYDSSYDNSNPNANANADDNSDYLGGPTIFDRRGEGASSYVPPVNDVQSAHSDQQADMQPPAPAPAEPETPPTPTVLIFKDGHQIEVSNYAIVGQTLFDLTPGHPRKIPIGNLNLSETEKQNDDRGVNFQVPTSGQAD